MPQRATLRKALTVANRSPNGGLLLHCAKPNSTWYPCPYIRALPLKVNGLIHAHVRGKVVSTKKKGPKKKAGGALPQAPP